MRRVCLLSLLALAWTANVQAAVPLPPPQGLPEGPPGGDALITAVDLPATVPDHMLPEGSEDTPDPSVPVIAAANTSVRPDETITITGEGLNGAFLFAAIDSQAAVIHPLRTAGDRMQAVVPKHTPDGHPIAHATTLVWPIRDRQAGEPIRINAPKVWWTWPGRVSAGVTSTLRLFGHDLSVGDIEPLVVLVDQKDRTSTLKTDRSDAYQIEAALPRGLQPGTYRLWVHNRTGGAYGWSEPLAIEVVPRVVNSDRQFHVNDFDPIPEDATEAILAAVNEAAKAGGGTIVFGPGEYRLTQQINLPKDPVISIKGAGNGGFDPSTQTVTDRQKTIIRFACPDERTAAFRLAATGSSMEGITIISSGKDRGGCVELAGTDQSIRRSTMIRLERSYEFGQIRCTTPGVADLEILDCNFHTYDAGVLINKNTDFVRIADCVMRGWYSSGKGTDSNAVINQGGNNMIMERCDVASHDRLNGKLFCRTALFYNSNIRNCYIADNVSRHMGPHPSVPGISLNTAEQFLFHSWFEELPPFAVLDANYVGIRVAGDLDRVEAQTGDWIVFIARGRGAGQWRVIQSVEPEGWLRMDRPWRLIPDKQSVAVVQQAIRHNLVLRNQITGDLVQQGVNRTRIEQLPTHGVAWWFNCFDNVTAENRFTNCSAVYITAKPTKASGWNLVRDNQWTHETKGEFMSVRAYPSEADLQEPPLFWYGIGNAIRNNKLSVGNGYSVMECGWDRPKLRENEHRVIDNDTGLAMNVFEHNVIEHTRTALSVSPPVTWMLWRSNHATQANGKAAPVHMYFDARQGDPLIIQSDSE